MTDNIAAEFDAETGEMKTRTMTETELAELAKTFEGINIGALIEPTETDGALPFVETTNPPPEDTEP
jgi:hypothetical protein